MIYKNGKQIDLDPKKKKELLEKFDFPVRVKYVKNFIKYDSVNKKNIMPPSIGVPFNSTVYVDGDVAEYRYAKSMTLRDGQPYFVPDSFIVQEFETINEQDIDKLYYLYFFCPYMSNGAIAEEAKRKGKRPDVMAKFVFEDLKGEAKEFVEREKLKVTVEALISNPELGVDETDLRRIAKIMFIPNAATQDIDILRKDLIMKTKTSKGSEGYNAFLEAKKNLGNSTVKLVLSEAIESGLIKYDGRSSKWFFMEEDGEKGDVLTIVPKGADKDRVLVDYLKDEAETLEEITESIKARKSL